jgi:hypothetical protein
MTDTVGWARVLYLEAKFERGGIGGFVARSITRFELSP